MLKLLSNSVLRSKTNIIHTILRCLEVAELTYEEICLWSRSRDLKFHNLSLLIMREKDETLPQMSISLLKLTHFFFQYFIRIYSHTLICKKYQLWSLTKISGPWNTEICIYNEHFRTIVCSY